MLTLERCRQILGPDVDLTDEELAKLRDDLYWLAEGAVEMMIGEARRRRGEASVDGDQDATPED